MRVFFTAITALFVLASCGESSEPDTKTAATKAMQEWVAAVVSGDGDTACARATREFQQELLTNNVSLGGVDTTCEDAVSRSAQRVRNLGLELDESSVEVVAKTDQEATVSLAFGDADPTTYELVLRDGSWKVAEEH